jgi:hypothetical protein
MYCEKIERYRNLRDVDACVTTTRVNNGYSSQNVRGQNRYSALSSVNYVFIIFPSLDLVSLSPRVMAYRFMIMFNT